LASGKEITIKVPLESRHANYHLISAGSNLEPVSSKSAGAPAPEFFIALILAP